MQRCYTIKKKRKIGNTLSKYRRGVSNMNMRTGEEEILQNSVLSITNNIEKTNKMKQTIYSIMKRIIDVSASIIGIIMLLPITLIIGVANICVKDKGPIFFVQERIGKNG